MYGMGVAPFLKEALRCVSHELRQFIAVVVAALCVQVFKQFWYCSSLRAHRGCKKVDSKVLKSALGGAYLHVAVEVANDKKICVARRWKEKAGVVCMGSEVAKGAVGFAVASRSRRRR